MLAKIAISLAGYVALSPEILTSKYRILFIGLAVGGLSASFMLWCMNASAIVELVELRWADGGLSTTTIGSLNVR